MFRNANSRAHYHLLDRVCPRVYFKLDSLIRSLCAQKAVNADYSISGRVIKIFNGVCPPTGFLFIIKYIGICCEHTTRNNSYKLRFYLINIKDDLWQSNEILEKLKCHVIF